MWENNIAKMYLYDENKNLIDSSSKQYTYVSTQNLNIAIGGKSNDSAFRYSIGKIDLSEIIIEKDDVIIWQ